MKSVRIQIWPNSRKTAKFR